MDGMYAIYMKVNQKDNRIILGLRMKEAEKLKLYTLEKRIRELEVMQWKMGVEMDVKQRKRIERFRG